MTDTLWADVSSWNRAVDDTYPYEFFAFRSNDGGYLDANFHANLAWTRRALAAGRLWGFIVYYFYRPGTDGAAILRQRLGDPPARMAVMIDVESDNGRVAGDQSGQINREHAELAAWLGDPRRVVGYGNVGDLNALWPRRPAGCRLVIAAYGTNPPYPGKFAHQFSSSYQVPPFGPCDINSADGMDRAALEAMFGFTQPAPVTGGEESDMLILHDLTPHRAVVLRVPKGKTRLYLHADPLGQAPPKIRVGWGPAWVLAGTVSPAWAQPWSGAVPAGCNEVTLSRQDPGDVPVTAAWE